MVRVLLIVALAGCSGSTQAPGTARVAPLGGSAASVPEALWDQGTFITVDRERIEPSIEERFEIYRTSAGYRMVIQWTRPVPTGEAADGKVTLELDARFSPMTGDDVMTLHAKAGVEVTHSSLRRDPDGRIATEEIAANGSKETAKSARPNDWYIGQLTTLMTALCQASPDITAPIVYPDRDTTLEPAKPLPIEGTTRNVTSRVLTYASSNKKLIAACEDGKLAGELTPTVTVVRTGDLALARALEKSFR